MQLTTDNNKADLEHNMSSGFLLSVSLDLFLTCFMVKMLFIEVGRYEPLKLRACSYRTRVWNNEKGILGDPGADSGGEGKSKQAEK